MRAADQRVWVVWWPEVPHTLLVYARVLVRRVGVWETNEGAGEGMMQ